MVGFCQGEEPMTSEPMTTLTPRRKEVLAYIIAYRRRHGLSPTFGEIAEGLDPPVSKASVCEHVDRLVDAGFLRRIGSRGASRAIEPAHEAWVELESAISVVVESLGDAPKAGEIVQRLENLPQHRI